ncbi:MAG: hypothetical protein KGL39_55190 [Patescibacteria group bacterium]|nr:hypothetical protein [Patescibacteria group bacterium]
MIRVSLACDYCGEQVGDEKNRRAAMFLLRLRMERQGWVHLPRSGKDYCPKCVNLMAAADEVFARAATERKAEVEERFS